MAALRAEIDSANMRADEYKASVKQLEGEHIQKDHDLHSVRSKVKLLESQLDKTENQIQATSAKYETTSKQTNS